MSYERAKVIAVDIPDDAESFAGEVTLVVVYPDGREALIAVTCRAMTPKLPAGRVSVAANVERTLRDD